MPHNDGQLIIENAELVFLNFAGIERPPYNAKGTRNFCVFLDPKLAAEMEADGYNIKETRPRDEGDEPRKFVKVNVNFGNRPPQIWLLTDGTKRRMLLTEDMVEILDQADIKNADIIVNPSAWESRALGSGTSAYLKQAFITIHENVLEQKYAEYGQAPAESD